MFLEINTHQKIKLEYDIFGKGEPLIFLHGGGIDFHFYEPFLDKLGEKYKVYTFSYPGFSRSSDVKSYSLGLFTDILDNFIEAMDLKEFILMGHSLGGGIATYYASHQNKFKIKSLILLSPATSPLTTNMLQMFRNLKAQWAIERKFKEDYFSLVNEYRAKQNVKSKFKRTVDLRYWINCLKQYSFIKSTNFIEGYDKLSMPVKIFWGDEDLVLQPESFAKAWGNLNRKNISVKVFKGYGHNVFFPKYKEIIDSI